MVRVAAIDCGTNSIRLLVTDIGDNQAQDQLRQMRMVRLGEGVDRTGRLTAEAIQRTVDATREFKELTSVLNVDITRFCATSAARDAANVAEFTDAIEAVLGIAPQILTGDQEARASFLGATRDLGEGPTAVTDIGGGSTELITGECDVVTSAVSLDIGSVRLTERFLASDPPSIAELAELGDHLDDHLRPVLSGWEPVTRFVGVAGTITTLAAHALGLPSYDHDRIHGVELDIEAMQEACLSMVRMSVADRRALPFMHPGRADVIGAGAMILDRMLHLAPLETSTMIISERDILDGIARGAIEPH